MPRVAIIGAGIVGLTTALELQDALPDAEVTIIAENFLEGTTSEGSGGIFRCGSASVAPNRATALRWLKDSWRYYQKLLRSSQGAAAGLTEFPNYMFADDERFNWNDILAAVIPSYRYLTPEEMKLAPAGAIGGTFCMTLSVQNDTFLPWAMNRFKARGGRFIQKKVASFQELTGTYDVVVNCTGMGAKYLADDPNLEPVRGQVYKVDAPWIKCGFYLGVDTYIIPNVDYLTVGGTRNHGSWDLRVDKYDSQSIWDRATSLCPSLKKARIIKEWVGLRPVRCPVRLEKQLVTDGAKSLKVVHNYGHGGYGVTLAPGTAKHAVQLVKEALSGNMGNPGESRL